MNIASVTPAWLATATLACVLAAPGAATAQSATPAAASPTVRIRRTVLYVDAAELVVKDRGGEVVSLARPADMPVSEVYAIKLAGIKKGTFRGTCSRRAP